MEQAALGVIGGSGFYRFLDDVDHVELDTPWGPPAGPIALGSLGDRQIAFLARHGQAHRFPAHEVPYRANVWALHAVGVRRVLAPCAAGSLRPDVHPGDFVVCDQQVDRTRERGSTYFDGPVVHHAAFADPYCPELRGIAVDAVRAEGVPVHERGTVVVIPGPRFSTRAESQWYRRQGWDVVNMTQAPEAALARELGLCYTTIALVTDYDSGVEDDPSIAPVTQDEVFATFEANVAKVRRVLLRALEAVPAEAGCGCAALGGPPPMPPSGAS
ncbi:MAG: S-methyl-5'-thioadenosine phosphorylase [Actinobacteria bacterium]|nr:S-methyl-5'-thioadenosine phosphorylase [Actinomycetota bacterium]